MEVLGQPLWIGFFMGILVGGILFNEKFRNSTLGFLFPKYRKKLQAKQGQFNNQNTGFYTNTGEVNSQYARQGNVIVDPYTGSNYHLDWNCRNVQPKERYVELPYQQISDMQTVNGKVYKSCPICVRGS